MINRILEFLTGPPEPRPLPAADADHLLGALLVRIAVADQAVQVEELRAMDRLLARHTGLNPVEAARMRADCERLAAVLPPTAELGPLLVSTIPPEQRFALRAALVEVAEADGSIDAQEAMMLDQVARLLEADALPAN